MPITVCPSGVAEADPNMQRLVYVTAASVEGALTAFGFGEVAGFLAPVIAGTTFDLTQLCADDPPADVTLTEDDVYALLNYTDIIPFGQAVLKARQWFLHWYWWKLCHCTGAQPVIPSAPSTPPKITNSGGLPSGSTPGACFDKTATRFVFGGFVLSIGGADTGLYAQRICSGAVDHSTMLPNPLPATVIITITNNADGTGVGGNAIIAPQIVFYDSCTNTHLVTDNWANIPIGGSATKVYAPSGTAPQSMQMNYSSGSGAENHSITIRTQCFGCAAGVGSPSTTCCPPDPLAESLLAQILALTTLIQRQTAPFAYVSGTTHASLANSGEITVQGLLGVKITPTAIPSFAGVVSGDPDTVWLESWIRWGNADGWGERIMLTASPFVHFPPAAGQWTKIGYTFGLGLECDVTELVREA